MNRINCYYLTNSNQLLGIRIPDMQKTLTSAIDIPEQMQNDWQNMLDILSNVINVPAALIMRIYDNDIKVFFHPVHPQKTLTLKGRQKNSTKGYIAKQSSKKDRNLLSSMR